MKKKTVFDDEPNYVCKICGMKIDLRTTGKYLHQCYICSMECDHEILQTEWKIRVEAVHAAVAQLAEALDRESKG